MEAFNAAEVILRRSRGDRARFASKPALIAGEEVVSYEQLWDAVARAAGALRAAGLARGDRLGLLLDEGLLAASAFLGAVTAGIIPIPLNHRFSAADYAFIAHDAGIKLFIAEAELSGLLREALRGTLQTTMEATSASGAALMVAREEHGSFEQRMFSAGSISADSASLEFLTVPAGADDPAFWLYSSGTTGRPKGIIHTHRNCAGAGKLLREAAGADASSVLLSTSRMFFAYGLENALLAPLSLGATSIQFARLLEPSEVVEAVRRHRVTCMLTVPSFYRRLLQLGKEALEPLRNVDRFYTGGERLPTAVWRAWQEMTGRPLLVGYGLSETLCNVTANVVGADRSPASIGRPLAGVECRLLDGEGRPVERGSPGTLWVRHPTLALGYSDPAATAAAFRDGWFCTRDLCRIDDDGFLYHEGRDDELLKIAGQWVRPFEIEEAALAAPGIREAACVVVRDADGFERVALYVVAETAGEGEAAARAGCAALPRFSRPNWVIEIGELPKNATGKIQRFRLREFFAGEAHSPNL